MSSILQKDRKESDMRVITYSREVCSNCFAFSNDENKIPKRYRFSIGASIQEHALNQYEYIREANRVFPDSKSLIEYRIKLIAQSESEVNRLNSDLAILPDIIKSVDKDATWYNESVEAGYNLEKTVHAWRRSENKRLSDIKAELIKKEKKKSAKIKEEQNNSQNNIKTKSPVTFANKSIAEIAKL